MSPRRFLLALLLFCAFPARAYDPKQTPTPAAPTAAATFVLDLDSSRVLGAKNADARLFPASTTKIMTCLVALERGKLNQPIRASQNAANTGESGIGVLPGETHTLADLVRAALVHSANDACVDIAEGVGGNQAQFVKWMNQKAKELGCRNTHFVNPHGLHDPQHFTSAHDLAVIARAALQNPFINEVARQKSVEIPGNWKIGPQRVLLNRNKLLWRWDKCDGFKTGYTRQAGNCLVATATLVNPQTRKPWRLLAVALKAHPNRSYSDCRTLLETAFGSFSRQTVAKKGEILFRGSLKGAAFDLEAAPTRDVVLPLRAREGQTLSRRVHIFDLTAPINQGALVGHAEYFVNWKGQPKRIADVALTARQRVPQTLLARALPPVGNHLRPWPAPLRAALLGLMCAGAAILLLLKRQHHARRRRPHSAFRAATLDSPSPKSKSKSRSESSTRR